MIEHRRVRFASIDGIERADLSIAAEIWVEDIAHQSWVTRDILKIAVLLRRYMASPDPRDLLVRSIEMRLQIDRKQIQDALRQMQMYGAVEAFGIDGDVVKVSLSLSVQQRLRTREVRHRFRQLGFDLDVDAGGSRLRDDGKWIPPMPEEAAEACESPAEFSVPERRAELPRGLQRLKQLTGS